MPLCIEEIENEGWESYGPSADYNRKPILFVKGLFDLRLIAEIDMQAIVNMGWSFLHPEGMDEVYYWRFTGTSWYQLNYNKSDGWIKIARRFFKDGKIKERVRFEGNCTTAKLLLHVCKLLKICNQ